MRRARVAAGSRTADEVQRGEKKVIFTKVEKKCVSCLKSDESSFRYIHDLFLYPAFMHLFDSQRTWEMFVLDIITMTTKDTCKM